MSQRILLPLEVADPTPLPGTLVQALAGTEVILVGLPGEDPPAADSEQGRRSRAFLHEQAAALLRAGADVSVETQYDGDIEALRANVEEHGAVDATYVPGPITTFGRLLVALRDERVAAETVDLLDGMNLEGMIHVTLFHVAADESERAAATEMLEGVAEDLHSADVPDPSVDVKLEVSDDPAFEIARVATEYDAVVMGETEEETVETEVFGPVYQRVRDGAEEPILLVRRER